MADVASVPVSGVTNARLVAYNENATRLAVSSGNNVQVLVRSDDLQTWRLSYEWRAAGDAEMTEMAWAHSEHGHVLACASEDGLISIYQQDTGQSDDQGQWTQKAHLGASIQPITGIQFAPKQLGLQLATASEDGYVRFYQADRPLDANTWQLNNDLQATSSGGCTCLAWRQHSHGLPAMLCIGTTQEAQIWYYRPALGDWHRAAKLGTGGAHVAAVHWAPNLSRPTELIAAACGTQVFVWSLQGKAHNLQIKQVACFITEQNVWKVKFAKFGTMLAASAAGSNSSSLHVWEPRPTEAEPAGCWQLQSKINGSADASDGEQAMLEE